MNDAIPGTRKKDGRGRPKGDAVSVHLRIPAAELAALDRWIVENDATQTRPAAIRVILKEKLGV